MAPEAIQVVEEEQPQSSVQPQASTSDHVDEQITSSVHAIDKTPKIEQFPYLAPRGIRLYHAEDNRTFTTKLSAPSQLKAKHAKTLEAIFDHQRFKNVSYGDFAALWRSINGPESINESKWGSHRDLLDANSKVVDRKSGV